MLRLTGERAAKRLAHWRGIASSASEQCGRTRLPQLHEVQTLRDWLAASATAAGNPASPASDTRHVVLSPAATTRWSPAAAGPTGCALVFLSGPEGGLSPTEENDAVRAGYAPVSLGVRVLRADTAPLAVLAWCGFESQPEPTEENRPNEPDPMKPIE